MNEIEFIARSIKEEIIVTLTDSTKPIKQSYIEGIEFDNERYCERDTHLEYYDS